MSISTNWSKQSFTLGTSVTYNQSSVTYGSSSTYYDGIYVQNFPISTAWTTACWIIGTLLIGLFIGVGGVT